MRPVEIPDPDEFDKVIALVNEACEKANGAKETREDAVNWSGLGTTSVMFCFHKNGESYWFCEVEEADPAAFNLRQFLWEYCQSKGFNVRIETRW